MKPRNTTLVCKREEIENLKKLEKMLKYIDIK